MVTPAPERPQQGVTHSRQAGTREKDPILKSPNLNQTPQNSKTNKQYPVKERDGSARHEAGGRLEASPAQAYGSVCTLEEVGGSLSPASRKKRSLAALLVLPEFQCQISDLQYCGKNKQTNKQP